MAKKQEQIPSSPKTGQRGALPLRYLQLAVALTMLATFLVSYLVNYKHVIIFHEQHHLFLFDWGYVREAVHQYGFWWPITEFFVQFGYWPWLGAAVWSLVFVAVYLMTQSIIRSLTGLRDLLQVSAFLPCYMFFQTVDVDFMPVNSVKAFFIVLGVWIVATCLRLALKGRYIWKGKSVDKVHWIWLPIALASFGGSYMYWSADYYKARTIVGAGKDGKDRVLTHDDVVKWRANEKLMIEADQAVRRQDWNEVLRLTNKVLAQGNNHLMAYFRSLALYHRGELTTHLFDMPQNYSEEALFFPWEADRNRAEYGGMLYEQLGAINSAAHWEFEAMVGWGETAQHLINLSRYYVKLGKPKQARKFLRPLHRTLFYRSVAKQIEGNIKQGDVPDLYDVYAQVPDSVIHFDNVMHIREDAKNVLRFAPEHKMAREYLLMSLLLTNNVGGFYKYLKQYWPKDEPLPPYFWQALCLVRMQKGEEGLKADGYEIPANIDADLKAYMAEMAKGDKGIYSPAQRQTYWYYATKVSKYAPSILIDDEDIYESPVAVSIR